MGFYKYLFEAYLFFRFMFYGFDDPRKDEMIDKREQLRREK